MGLVRQLHIATKTFDNPNEWLENSALQATVRVNQERYLPRVKKNSSFSSLAKGLGIYDTTESNSVHNLVDFAEELDTDLTVTGVFPYSLFNWRAAIMAGVFVLSPLHILRAVAVGSSVPVVLGGNEKIMNSSIDYLEKIAQSTDVVIQKAVEVQDINNIHYRKLPPLQESQIISAYQIIRKHTLPGKEVEEFHTPGGRAA